MSLAAAHKLITCPDDLALADEQGAISWRQLDGLLNRATNALLALGIAWRFVALRADWSAWNTAALAHATMAPRADLSTDATAAPPPPVSTARPGAP